MTNTDDGTSIGPVAIIGGTGDLGYAVALALANVGIPIRIGSRRLERAQEAAGRVRERLPDADVQGAENAEAAQGAPLVVISVPFAGHAATVKGIAGALEPGQIVVDATVPLATAIGGKPTRPLGIPQGSAAEQARELVPDGVGVVAGLHSVGAEGLANLDEPLEQDVLLASDDRAHTRTVAAVLELVPGLRCVDTGPLERAALLERLTPLLIAINLRNKVHAGLRITGLPERAR